MSSGQRDAGVSNPAHVAIIMDGNGRWAQMRGLPRQEGHRRGLEALRRTVRNASDLGIRVLTLYSFSTENWRRPYAEVSFLMGLLKHFVEKDLAELSAANVRVRIIGSRDDLAADLRRLVEHAETSTSNNTGLVLVIAFNYGSRDEIMRATRRLAADAVAGRIDPAAIDEAAIARQLDTHDLPDPELVIRTSGETRISNFLLWQAAYAEFIFAPVMWPDFDRAAFEEALAQYRQRERRFGGLSAPSDRSVGRRVNEPNPSVPRSNSELKLRVASALVLGALILLVTIWGGWPFRLVWILVAGLVAYEWLAIIGRGNAIPAGIAVVAAGLALAFSPSSPAALAGTASAMALLGAVATPFVRSRLALELCGVAYALAFALVTPALRDLPGIGLALILWSFAVVWLTDIAAYFTGRKLGGPKLMPAVSPKKTWSGAIGGAVAGMIGGYLVWRLVPALQSVTAAGPVVAASLAGSVVSQAGDLFESALKRRFDAKDSSKLIPGHGGFLDRLDGYWAVLVLAGFALFALHLNGLIPMPLRSVTLLGATGSVGRSVRDVVAENPERLSIATVVGGRDAEALARTAIEVGASFAALADAAGGAALKQALSGTGITSGAGRSAVLEAVDRPADIVVSAISGAAGLEATFAALLPGRTIALANKESLVCAGEAVMARAAAVGARLLPLDSEHNALFQVLGAEPLVSVRNMTLTASGGPFRTWSTERIAAATPDQALKHPNYAMGAKITIDSASMMNKGLELIEARFLFDLQPDQLDVLVHPQQIVHGLVTFRDGSVSAGMAVPDMRVAAAHCLGIDGRLDAPPPRFLDLALAVPLSFERPDLVRFPALGLAMAALREGGAMPAVLNAANEIAVAAFLERRLRFADIAALVEAVCEASNAGSEAPRDVAEALAIDHDSRRRAASLLSQARFTVT